MPFYGQQFDVYGHDYYVDVRGQNVVALLDRDPCPSVRADDEVLTFMRMRIISRARRGGGAVRGRRRGQAARVRRSPGCRRDPHSQRPRAAPGGVFGAAAA